MLSRVDDGCGDVPLEEGGGESGHADVETSRTLIGEVKFDTSDDGGGVGRSVKERLGICLPACLKKLPPTLKQEGTFDLR